MITKNGICLNLEESNYKILKYGVIFYFSSLLYLEKFEKEVENYINTETIKLRNKYKVDNDFTLYLAISFYKKIEKRGFYIYDEVNKRKIKNNSLFISILK